MDIVGILASLKRRDEVFANKKIWLLLRVGGGKPSQNETFQR